MTIGMIANPGAGTVHAYGNPSLRDAWKNIRRFRRDMGEHGVRIVRRRGEDDDGRYLFVLERDVKRRKTPLRCDIMMPGLPLRQVRFREDTSDDAWHFPRLLIGKYGSSWLWPFALNDARGDLEIEFP